MAIKLLVEDFEDVVVAEDDVEDATGEQLFKAMNSLCRFDLWARADVWVGRRNFEVSNADDVRQDKAYATMTLQHIMDRVGASASGFRLIVQKKEDRQSEGPAGPYPPQNPGLRPRHGPDYGGFETPAGPGVSLARMSGMLERV